ncbi:MAG: DUF2182 domain-containing protein [Halioglobus sp.]
MSDTLARRDRLVLLGGIAAIVLVCWWDLVDTAAMLAAMPNMMFSQHWSFGYFLMMLLMWMIMMTAMMLPSVMPVILLFRRVAARSGERTRPLLRSAMFANGYLIAWAGFSVAATLLQWALDQRRLLSPALTTLSPALGGGLLIAAGLYQWTPLKRACLEHCRGPVHFLTQRWRRTPWGALRMGLEHGLYCIGCCRVIMALLFVGGVMNLLWIAALSLFVIIEKILPAGPTAGRIAGALSVLAGLSIVVAYTAGLA